MGIDIGGTFTDIGFFEHPANEVQIEKYLTSENPADTVIQTVDQLDDTGRFSLAECEVFTHATTIATNVLLEQKGEQVGLITTSGFEDIIEMRDESRYDLYDVNIDFPDPIPERRYRSGVDERITHTGEVETQLDEDDLRETVGLLQDRGVESIAICFLHSYVNDEHERRAEELIATEFPSLSVSRSSDIAPKMGEYARFITTVINSYVKSNVTHYLESLKSRFTDRGFDGTLLIMTSGGGVIPPESAMAQPVQLLESGPTAGALMAQHIGRKQDSPDILSFDMGGTTSKGCIIDEYTLDKSYTFEAARTHEFKEGSGYPVLIPNVNLIEFGSGGGSIAKVDTRGTLQVGPQSAGANPGPACYGNGGRRPTITDADVALGYLRPETFTSSSIDIDPKMAREAIRRDIAEPLDIDVVDAAAGVIEYANENISNAFREHAAERGVDVRKSDLLSFGGAGPMHAERIAESLGIDRVVVPPNAGVLTGIGLLVTPKAISLSSEFRGSLTATTATELENRFQEMEREALAVLSLDADEQTLERVFKIDLRFEGQGFDEEIEIPARRQLTPEAIRRLFLQQYEQRYGVAFEKPITITELKLELSSSAHIPSIQVEDRVESPGSDDEDPVISEREAYFPQTERHHDVEFRDRAQLSAGNRIDGPTIIEDTGSTIVVGPTSVASVDEYGNVNVRVDQQ
jgi:N-methylhydantoinase A